VASLRFFALLTSHVLQEIELNYHLRSFTIMGLFASVSVSQLCQIIDQETYFDTQKYLQG